MKIIEQSHFTLAVTSPLIIEAAGRTAYLSEDKITEDSYKEFIKKIVKSKHESVLEHSMLTVRFITDRGVSHEIVRHRLCAFTQESTRYCNYSKGKFEGQLTFIKPVWLESACLGEFSGPVNWVTTHAAEHWLADMLYAEKKYMYYTKLGWSPQQARSILPNSLKTTIVVTANFREWRHIFQLRAIEKAAHPQMRALMIPLYEEMRKNMPEVFDMGEVET